MRSGAALRQAGCAAALVLAAAPAAGAAERRYGDSLVARTLHRFPAITGLAIDAIDRDGAPIAIAAGPMSQATVAPLTDAMGARIGTVTVATRRLARPSASAVAAYLGRRIYVADNLRESDPFAAGARQRPFAQALVDRMLDRFPDLVTLAMHVAPPGQPNVIIASSFGRIGKPADVDDRRVADTGAILREVTNGGARLAVELPLTDRRGRTLGALSTSLRIPVGNDPQTVYPRAVQVRNTLAREIVSLDALVAVPSTTYSRRKR